MYDTNSSDVILVSFVLVIVSDAEENTILQGIVPVLEHLFDRFAVSFDDTAKEAFVCSFVCLF